MKNHSLSLRAGQALYRCLGMTRSNLFSNRMPAAILSAEDGNQLIKSTILAGAPSMVSRFGTPESNAILNAFENRMSHSDSVFLRIHAACLGLRTHWDDNVRHVLQQNVGFFPNDVPHVEKFVEFYTGEIRMMDSMGFWGFVPGERYLMKKYCPDARVFKAQALEPFYFSDPWSGTLFGKRVLVIHPFSESIQSQYGKRDRLFKNPEILPEFSLRTIRAVQSLAGNPTEFPTWFDGLSWMKSEMEREDFDVCLVGAGSYGLPLCAHAKRLGRVGIHIGGGLQILFGIKGKRWDSMKDVSQFYNDHWSRPIQSETIPSAGKVEDGCYW